jgi:cyclophilin family peptidyl-prolyl cis-trans isomerase/HEAT repeat protein
VTRTIAAITLACMCAACASAPPAVPVRTPPPAGPTAQEKLGWIVHLENARLLRDPASAAQPPPDLIRLLTDSEARIRRRSALAVGRVGLREGTAPVAALLSDGDPEVRQMAAFALGLIGDTSARDGLVMALADQSVLVRGSAAEALGLIGDPAAAGAIGRMVAAIVQSGALTPVPLEEDEARRDTLPAAFRLGVFALVRLKAYDALAAAVLDPSGQPLVRWWPAAYALQRIDDARALPALTVLARESQPYTRAFAIRGLGRPMNRAAVPVLLQAAAGQDRMAALEAIRALGRIGDPAAAPVLLKLVQAPKADPVLRVDAVAALGGVGGAGTFDALVDLLGDKDPLVRGAVLRSLAAIDREGFLFTLSALDPDPHWSVRAALASVLGTLPPDSGLPRLRAMLADADQRVIPSVVAALAKVHAPDLADVLIARLKADDAAVRAAAATALVDLKPPAAAGPLADAYHLGLRDSEYGARWAALTALAQYGAEAAPVLPVLNEALADKDWAVRVQAASLLKQYDSASDADLRIRPAPGNNDSSAVAASDEAERLANPDVSPQVYIDTDRGTIQIELAVLDAPVAAENFLTLARKGFFNGLTFHRVVANFMIQGGDPRGDGEGGPGYTMRDELSERAYLRGTVGMALDGRDTGGSQFFITELPQPQLDARYTAFGRVVMGMDVVDQIQQWDVIRAVRVNPKN